MVISSRWQQNVKTGAPALAKEQSQVEELGRTLGCEWPALTKARQQTQAHLIKIQTALAKGEKLDSEDRSIVAFGSVARNECTSGSDLDWTLLIDGGADSGHLGIARAITAKFDDLGIKGPSLTGAFGNLTFSHDLIHQIGGEDDTNRNTTQRILLLLESRTIGSHHEAYDRVITGVLNRYLEDDQSLRTTGCKVPRFLLNDIARFWRTMAVDFATKQRERAGKGWGLRSIKLRMSRKLVFASGLLICFGFHLTSSVEKIDFRPGAPTHPLVNHLRQFIGRPPLEIVANAFLAYSIPHGTARKLFDAYNEFLGLLDDEIRHGELDELKPDEARTNQTFQDAPKTSHQFQAALTEMFFDHHTFADLTKTYGVF